MQILHRLPRLRTNLRQVVSMQRDGFDNKYKAYVRKRKANIYFFPAFFYGFEPARFPLPVQSKNESRVYGKRIYIDDKRLAPVKIIRRKRTKHGLLVARKLVICRIMLGVLGAMLLLILILVSCTACPM